MGARKYTPLILEYCRANGIEVPAPFERRPASRFAVIRLEFSPPKLSTMTFFKKEDLHHYLQTKMRELKVPSAIALPVRVLDFKDNVVLIVTPDGRTRPGASFDGDG